MPKFVNLIAFLQKLISKERIVVIMEFPDWFKLTLFWTGGGQICPPSWFFEYSSETVRSRKLKLCDF